MATAIETRKLTKFYGTVPAIDDIDLVVTKGEVFGFLGPNGAGKTTTMRVLMDFIRPSSGQALIFGLDSRADSREIRRRVGYLSGELSLYESLTSLEMFEFLADLRGLDDLSNARRLAELLELAIGRPIGELSHGNKQKAGIVQALMHEPELAILDEPTSGLDPIMQRVFFSILREMCGNGTTFFLSSHVLDEVRRVADRIGIIGQGRLLAVKAMDELEPVVTLDFRFAQPVPADIFDGIPGVDRVTIDDLQAQIDVTGPVHAVLRAATAFEVIDLRSTEASLEDVFLRYVGASNG